ncbi:BamA/TamA family outer membrane protein, partial [Rhodovulum sulfidophilum]|uniref:BamA/TamA family outer membrane protein n=1 Tax=Rhodovulum sulfidophilum TaxID=35806 RepID=UPI001F360851
SLLFFSGGGGTVRGQPYQSLAVDLPNGDRIGGRSFIGLSGEARVGVTRAIQMVAFYDAGFVGPDSWVSDGDWQSGAGLGLRYDTGIGPIRFDVAAPVDGDTGDGVQFYIGIGQAF